MSLPPEQRTMLTTREDGSQSLEPIPGMEVCDFCTGTPVAFAYPCGPVLVGTHISVDPWGACEDCHALIEDGNGLGLVVRSVDRFDASNGPLSGPERESLAISLASVQQQFHDARLGAAQPK